MQLIVLPIFLLAMNFAFAQIPGNSLILNGTTDWVEVQSNSSLDIPNNLTLEAWIYPCNTSGEIISKLWCGGNQDQFHFYTSNGFLGFVWNDVANCGTVSTYQSTTNVITTPQWYHVAVVHTNTSVLLFLNGILISGSLTSGFYSNINLSISPLRIGVYRGIMGNYGNYFKGRIDEVRVWNTALTPAEIFSRYNTSLTGSETNLVAYYNMELMSTGQSINIPNKATTTGNVNDGKTMGGSTSPFFMNNSTSLNCNNICPSPSVNLGKDTTLCNGQNLILNPGTGFSSYLWQDNSVNGFFNVINSGKYWVRVQNSCGIASDTINIVYKSPPAINLGKDTTLCNGQNLILNPGSGFSSYLWQDNSSNGFFNVNSSGKYWVKVQNNCTIASDTINISYKGPPIVNLGKDTSLCSGSGLFLNAGNSFNTYKWQDNSINTFFNIVKAGKYWVTAQNNCGSSNDTIEIKISDLFIPNLITPNADTHNDHFEITGSNGDNIEIEFFNIWGNEVYKNKNYKNDWDGGQLADGTYYYSITYPKCNKTYKGWFHMVK
jgi:gliding motility-associated-like protein